MEPKHLILIFSLAVIVFVSGCTQLASDSKGGRCAKGNIEVIDADGSLSPEAGLDKVDTKRCFVKFKPADNIYVVLEDGNLLSIYKDLDGDKTFTDANDKNILTAQEEDQGTHATDIEGLFYNDIENSGKYINALPTGLASEFVIGADDIGLLSKVPAICGDGKLNQQTEECDPPGGVCQNNGICEAGKCKCVGVSGGGGGVGAQTPAAQPEPQQGDKTSDKPKTRSQTETQQEPSQAGTTKTPAKKVSFSIANKLTKDVILSKLKLLINGKAATCSPAISLTIAKGAAKSFSISASGSGQISADNILKIYNIEKEGDEINIGGASITAGLSEDVTISEIKLESTVDKKSSSCKSPSAEEPFIIPQRETHLMDLNAKAVPKPAATTSTGTGLEDATSSAASPSASQTAAPTSTTSTSTASPTATTTASATPTATASATPTPTSTSCACETASPSCCTTQSACQAKALTWCTAPDKCVSGTCTSTTQCGLNVPIPAGGCSCGGTLKTSGYCCGAGTGTWSEGSCSTPPPSACPVGQYSSSICTCGSATQTTGYCCYNSCATETNNGYTAGGAFCPNSCSPTYLSLCSKSTCCTGALGQWCTDSICRSAC